MSDAKVTGMATTSNLPATDEQLTNLAMPALSIAACKQVRQWFAPKDATSADIAFFVGMAEAKGLNIWNEDIYMVPFYGKEGRKYAPVTSYQIYLDRADQSGVWDGMDIEFDDDDNPTKCTVTIYRKDWSRPGKRTTLLSEVMRTKKDGSPMASWGVRLRQMFEKCAVVAALRFYIPACRRLPYLDTEIAEAKGYNQPQKLPPQISQGSVTGAEAVNPDADIDYLRGQYFKLGSAIIGKDDEARHKWQEDNIGKASLTNWTADDFRKALNIIDDIAEAEGLGNIQPEADTSGPTAEEMEAQLGQDAPESYLEEEAGEVVTKTTDEPTDAPGELEIDTKEQTKGDKVTQIVQMVAETRVGAVGAQPATVNSPGFVTWASGIIGKGASNLARLPKSDLDMIITELNLRVDQEADKKAAEQGELL